MATPISITAKNGETYTFYYDETTEQGQRMFGAANVQKNMEKLTHIVNELERERAENPRQEVNRSIIIGSFDASNAEIATPSRLQELTPFTNAINLGDSKKFLLLYSGFIEEEVPSSISAVLEHELGHVLRERNPIGTTREINHANYEIGQFSLGLTNPEAVSDKHKKEYAEERQLLERMFANPDELSLRSRLDSEKSHFIAYCQENNIPVPESLKIFTDEVKTDISAFKSTFKIFCEKQLAKYEAENKPQFVTIDVSNTDFNNYIAKVQDMARAGDALFTYLEDNFTESTHKLSKIDYAKHLIESNKTSTTAPLVELINNYALAADALNHEPFGNKTISKPLIVNGVPHPGVSEVAPSPYLLPDNSNYTLPDPLPKNHHLSKQDYEALFEKLQQHKKTLQTYSNHIENLWFCNEIMADFNVNSHIGAAIDDYKRAANKPINEAQAAINLFSSGEDTHLTNKERLAFFEKRGKEVSSKALAKLEECMNAQSDGGTAITQEELNKIAKIGGDLVKIINDGKNSSITISDGSIDVITNVAFKNTKSNKVSLPD